MHFSEDDLRKALRPQDPGPAFTQRVMARISQQGVEQEKAAKAAALRQKRQWPSWLHWLTVRPMLSGAVAALVLVIAIGLGYRQYERIQRQKIEDARKAKEAEQQVMLALRITNSKMNHVFKRVSEQMAQDDQPTPKTRRQTL